VWQNAEGRLGNILLILRGSSVTKSVFDLCYRSSVKTSLTATKKGQQTRATFIEELKLKCADLGGTFEEPAVLLLDGHTSRLQRDVVHESARNNLYIIVEPSHTSMIHQSLDNGTNGYIQMEYERHYSAQLACQQGYASPVCFFAIHDHSLTIYPPLQDLLDC
jgi:hypothetical protein